jgi:hypothetical protein
VNWKEIGCSHGLITYYPGNFLERLRKAIKIMTSSTRLAHAFVLSGYAEKSDALPHQFFQKFFCVRFVVLMPVTMKRTIFWDII